MRLFAEISKVDDNDDGTIDVFGIASTESRDSQGDIVTKSAMTDALPDYLLHGTGALRAMHQPIAAGYVYKAEVNADGNTEICAKVVDPVEVTKCKHGVYKGFSIGGSKLPGGYDPKTKTISKMRLTEISLVDRPANPEATISMWKGEDMNHDQIDATVSKSDEDAVTELAEIINKGDIAVSDLVQLAKAAIEKGMPADTKEKAEAKDDKKSDEKDEEESDDKKTEKSEDEEESDGKDDKKAEKADGNSDIKKGLYAVQEFAVVLSAIGSMAASSNYEATYEGDNSPVPAALRGWLATGAEIFQTMAQEEISELLAQLAASAPESNQPEVVTLSDSVADLKKSLESVSSIDSISEFINIAKGHVSLAEISKGLSLESGDHVIQSQFPAMVDVIVSKAMNSSIEDSITKLANLTTEFQKLTAERDSFAKRIAELEAKPAAGKGTLRVVIDKGSDLPKDNTEVSESTVIKKSDGSIDQEATAIAQIKKLHQEGGHRGLR